MDDELRQFLAKARGTAATGRVLSLDDLRRSAEDTKPWGLPALRGRLVELSARGATATLTAAIGLVLEAQTASEPVAWITRMTGSFYPPDVADSGVDLSALVVVRVTEPSSSGVRAAERLLRSGAFGLVVLDLGTGDGFSMAHQGRLVTLAQAHDAAVVCLTDKTEDTASLGSLVSLRAEVLRRHVTGAREYDLSVRVLKDKRRGPGWTQRQKVRGPAGF